jgi:hypothetical protein
VIIGNAKSITVLAAAAAAQSFLLMCFVLGAAATSTAELAHVSWSGNPITFHIYENKAKLKQKTFRL